MKKSFLGLLCFIGLVPSAFAFEQKIVTRYTLEDTAVPRAVSSVAKSEAWESNEMGPVRDLKEYARTDNGIVWLGSSEGAARFNPYEKHPWERWQYFGGKRWLQDNEVKSIWLDTTAAHETVWIRRATGINRIELKPMGYADKAAHYDELVEKYHLRHNFVSKVKLTTPGDLSTAQTNDNDNDGLWSAMYLVA